MDKLMFLTAINSTCQFLIIRNELMKLYECTLELMNTSKSNFFIMQRLETILLHTKTIIKLYRNIRLHNKGLNTRLVSARTTEQSLNDSGTIISVHTKDFVASMSLLLSNHNPNLKALSVI